MRNTQDLGRHVLRALRLRAQHLTTDAPPCSIADLAGDLCGIQAQDSTAAALAMRARAAGFTAADVDRDRELTRTIVRTWAMRYTLHLLDARDVRRLVALLGPRLIRQKLWRFKQLGLDNAVIVRALPAIREILAQSGPLTRAELMAQLGGRDIPTEGQAAPYLVSRGALEGLVCFGPERGGEPTYVLLDDWLPPDDDAGDPSDDEVVLGALVLRYLMAYGPAQPEDFAAWSGLGMREARAGFAAAAGELLEVSAGDATYWLPQAHAAWLDEPNGAVPIRLLPAFDLTMLGYRSRAWLVPEAYDRQVNRGGGMVRPVLLVDGAAVGTWRLARSRVGATIEVEPFAPEALGREVAAALADEAMDIGRFLGLDTRLVLP